MANKGKTGKSIKTALNFSSVKLSSCKLSGEEIRDLVKIITIEESVYSKLLKGTVIFKDADNRYKNILDLVIGEMKIDIQLTAPDIDPEIIELSFLLENYNQIVKENNDSSQYLVLNFMETSLPLFKQEYSTSFVNKAGTDFVKEFSKNVLNKDLESQYSFIEPSSNKLSITFPYQRFKYILAYLNQYLISDNGYYNYIYFSNLLATNFSSLSYLCTQDPQYIFAEQKESLTNNVVNRNNFSEYNILNKGSIVDNISDYALGSTKFSFDHVNKQILEEEIIDYNKYGIVGLGGQSSNFDKNLIKSRNRTYYSSTSSFKNEMALSSGLFNNGDEIQIPNMEGDISRQVGRVASLIFKDNESTSQYNETLSTNYMISSIVHNIYPNAYKQDISFIRTAKIIRSSSNQELFTKYNSLQQKVI
jgi:hypothetical protein